MANLSGRSCNSAVNRGEPFASPSAVSGKPLRRAFGALLALFAGLAPVALHAQRVTLPTGTPALSASIATDHGALPAATPVTLTVRLAIPAERSAALKQRIADQLDPSSTEYHKWLTPQQFAASFGATDDQIATAAGWFNAQLLSVTSVSAAHTTMTVQGPAAQIQTAFGVSLHQMQAGASTYYANATQPSLPADAAAMIVGVSGLDDLPASMTLSGSAATDLPGAIAAVLDANTSPLLSLSSTLCNGGVAQADLDTYTALFQQANAQGVTVLAASACATGLGAFPASLSEVTAIALPSATVAANPLLLEARPGWQTAPGLPDDQFRHEPDLTASSLDAFAQTIASIAASSGGRLGNINRTLYDLAPMPGLFTQADGAAAGTWEAGSGLGLVDLDKLVKVFPRGSGSSFTSLGSPNFGPAHGASATMTSQVTSGTGGAIPTGTVSFVTSTGTTLGSKTLDATGNVSFSLNTLPAGSTTVTANYSGDTTYAPSISPSGTFTVTQEFPVITATVSTGNTIGGTYTVTVTVTASSGVGHPTGNASVTLSGTTTSFTGALVASSSTASSSVTITVPATIVGTSSLLISCVGDSNFICNNPLTTTVTVGKATPTLGFTFTPNPAVSGAAIAFTGTMAAVGTAPIPSGNVSFFDNGTLINAGALNASGKVQVTGTDVTAATHVITAHYDGDANYTVATATANGTGVTTTSLASSAPKNTGQAFTFTGTVAGTPVVGSTLPTGTVAFFDGLTSLGSGPVVGNGASINVASLSTTTTHSITAVYSGDTLYATSTSPAFALAVASGTATTTTVTPNATKNTGQSITLNATVAPSTVVGGTQPSGSVAFFDGNASLGTSPLAANAASLAVTTLSTTVSHSITAVYSGDTLYATSTSPAATISAASTTASVTTITASPTTVTTATTAVIYTATVASSTAGGTAPTGTVALTLGGTALCTITLSAGTGTCTPTATLASGANVVTGIYSGDSTYATSSGTTTVTDSAAAVVGTLAATVTPATGAYNTTASVAATITVAAGSTIPAGATVSASYSGVAGTYTGTVTAGAATITIPVPPPATYNILVSCVATSAFSCSNTVNLPFVATPSASTTSLSINPVTVLGGQTFTLTATVAPSPGTTALTTALPSGTVTFFNNGVAIGSANVNSSGVATRTTSLAAGGTGVYTATYNGDKNYLTSTTASPVSITATKISPTIVFFSNGSPTLQGLNVIFTIQVTNFAAQAGTVPTPSGTVTLYDTSTGIPLFIGTATLGSNGVATGIASFSTTGLFAGPHSIYAVYTGDGNYLPVTSTTVTVDVSDFSLSFLPQTLNVSRGSSVTTTVAATPIDQFNGTITMACTAPADMLTTCTITPSVLSGGGTAILTITTTAAGHASLRPGVFAWRVGSGTMLSMLFFFAIPRSRRRRLRSAVLVALAVFGLGITAGIGCQTVANTGGTTSNPGTPLGTAIFTVTAQGQESIGTNRHSYPLQVTITQ